MIENKMPQTWLNTDFATTKALIDSKLQGALPTLEAPGNFTATPDSQTQITLTWDVSPNATNYVLRRGGGVIYSGALLTFADTGLTAETLYNYTVVAEAAGYNNSPESATSATTQSAGLSPEAQAVIDRMTALSQNEIDSIAAFVDAEVLASNWDKYDEFFCFALSGSNALQGFFAKTATNNGAILNINGATFNGTSDYIDTNYNPTIDNVSYSLNDAAIEVFIKTASTQDGVYIGSFGVVGTNTFSVMQRSSSQKRILVNTADELIDTSGDFISGSLYAFVRTANNSTDVIEDGALLRSGSQLSSNVPPFNFYVGARNSVGSASTFVDATISTVRIGSEVGFDSLTHNTNIVNLLTSLGTI